MSCPPRPPPPPPSFFHCGSRRPAESPACSHPRRVSASRPYLQLPSFSVADPPSLPPPLAPTPRRARRHGMLSAAQMLLLLPFLRRRSHSSSSLHHNLHLHERHLPNPPAGCRASTRRPPTHANQHAVSPPSSAHSTSTLREYRARLRLPRPRQLGLRGHPRTWRTAWCRRRASCPCSRWS